MCRTIAALTFLLLLSACEGQFQANSAALRAAEDAYDPQLLRASLADIEAWHVENKTGLAETLGSSASVADITASLESTDCQPTEEMKALWSWHNGESSVAPFIWYHDFLSLEDAVSEYRWLTLNPLVRWDPNYIPLFSFEGEWYAGDCGIGSNTAGPVASFFLEDGAQTSHVNITTFLAGMAEAMRTGAVTWEDGAMVEDIHEVHRIYQKHNPGYKFPYYVHDES